MPFSDLPAPADYDGDGINDVAVYRDNTWYLLQSGFRFGAAGDKSDSQRLCQVKPAGHKPKSFVRFLTKPFRIMSANLSKNKV